MKPEPEAEGDKLAVQIAVDARFDHAALDVETIRYFFDDEETGDPFDDEAVTRLRKSHITDLGYFLDPAGRTWDRMISFGSELFRRVVQYASGQPAEAVLKERDNLRRPENPLDEDPALSDVVQAINSQLSHFFSKPVDLRLRITTTDSSGVLSSVFPHYKNADGTTVPSRKEGSGLISLQTLALLLQFGNLRKAQGENFILALEEPELHIPPPLQRRLLFNMKALTTQTIITTHSPTIAALADPLELVMVRQDSGVLTATPVLDEDLADSPNAIRQLLFSYRTELVDALMHQHLLIPEGRNDYAWFRRLSRVIESHAYHSDNHTGLDFTVEVGVVLTPSSIEKVAEFLSPKHSRVMALIDGDKAGADYLKTLLTLAPPLRSVFVWSEDWTIEDVICWCIQVDEAVLTVEQLREHQVPETIDELREAFTQMEGQARLKDNLTACEVLADAMASSEACRARISSLLAEMAAVARNETDDLKLFERNVDQSTEATEVWTFVP